MILERKISKTKYFMAGFFTLVIFLLGLFLGFVIEGKRVSYIEESSRLEKLDFNSLQLQYSYVEQLSQEGNCDAVSKTFESTIESLEKSRIRLENFEQTSKINKYEFELLRREYMNAQMRYWLLASRSKEICDVERPNILYFYSTKKDCPDCQEQAFILTYLKKLFDDKVLIFSFDGKYEDEPMFPILKKTYGIETYPSIVIEGEVFHGFTSKDDVLQEVCKHYTNESECAEFSLDLEENDTSELDELNALVESVEEVVDMS